MSLGVPEEIWPIAAVKCLEAMPFPLPARYENILRRASSCEGVLIGPGLGRAPRTERLVRSLLEDLEGAGGAGRRRHKRAGRAYR